MATNRSLRRSITDFKRHPWLHVVSVSTISIALLIVGAMFLAYRNFENLAERTNPSVTGTIYLKDGMTRGEGESLTEHILAMEGVKAAVFKNHEVVVQELQTFLGSAGGEKIPGSELFPDVIEIQLNKDATTSLISAVKAKLAKYPEIVEVDFSDDWLMQYKKARQFFRVFGFIVMIGIVLGCSFIIANFMGMRHQSRKYEIDVVRLIGGHNKFIIAPFLWEGLIEGLIGSLVALFLLFVCRGALSTIIPNHWVGILGIKSWMYLSPLQMGLTVLFGIVMALMGSVTVFLRFQEKGTR